MQLKVSEWIQRFERSMLDLSEESFQKLALELFQLHYAENEIYRKYCNLLEVNMEQIQRIEDIPFLPISFFKSHQLLLNGMPFELVFSSSGTTGEQTSKHYLPSIELYKKSFMTAFQHFYGKAEDYHILALLPSYLEREGSSLVKMVEQLIASSDSQYSGFFLKNTSKLEQVLNTLNERKEKVLLVGVSFALIDYVEQHKVLENSNMVVMETGGMKGRRREMVREELHAILKQGFKCETIHSEYGMTELLSQAYSKEEGVFEAPPWMKVLIRKQDDPFSYCSPGITGAINVIDLANVYSCPFIQTDDLGRMQADGKFEVLGRFDQSDVRGCNLMVV
mgnify:CR=1 FL=1